LIGAVQNCDFFAPNQIGKQVNMDVTDRFLKYVSFCTQSSESSETVPSTPGQRLLGEALAEELVNMGLKVKIDEYGYVYGEIPATTGFEHEPVIGLIAHMDTSESASGENIRPKIIKAYDGEDIVLNQDRDIVMRPSEFASLKDNVGKDLIVTDGTTLLGADDKAGVAEIMTLAQKLSESPDILHGRIMLAFTPDEEVGRGANHFDIAGLMPILLTRSTEDPWGSLSTRISMQHQQDSSFMASIYIPVKGKIK
jgi:tripeptide aminopeptidase